MIANIRITDMQIKKKKKIYFKNKKVILKMGLENIDIINCSLKFLKSDSKSLKIK